eukprot:gene17720-21130_t
MSYFDKYEDELKVKYDAVKFHYKHNSDIYHLLRAAAGMDIFFLVGFYIISFFNICCGCYKEKRVLKKALPKFVVQEPVVNSDDEEYSDNEHY